MTTDDAELLRVTVPRPAGATTAGAADGGAAAADGDASEPVVLVPDRRRRLGGRGAWVHPDPACLALAERRRAFVRALRLRRPVQTDLVRAALPAPARSGSGDGARGS